jgi:hypothetical protein
MDPYFQSPLPMELILLFSVAATNEINSLISTKFFVKSTSIIETKMNAPI